MPLIRSIIVRDLKHVHAPAYVLAPLLRPTQLCEVIGQLFDLDVERFVARVLGERECLRVVEPLHEIRQSGLQLPRSPALTILAQPRLAAGLEHV